LLPEDSFASLLGKHSWVRRRRDRFLTLNPQAVLEAVAPAVTVFESSGCPSAVWLRRSLRKIGTAAPMAEIDRFPASDH